MAKRKKQESSVVILILIIGALISFIIRIIKFLYDSITLYTSKYRVKSGNNFFKTLFNKGNYGEFTFYRKIVKIFGKGNVLVNVYLDSINTETTETDVLAISKKGIYVFEVKNYGGWIYGSEKDKHWTQVFHKNSKHRFYNPLLQNYAHVQSVIKYLNIDKDIIIPIISFSNKSKLKEINISANSNVFNFNDSFKYIRRIEKTNDDILTDQNIELYLEKLIEKTKMSDEVKRKHIENIKEHIISKE